MCVSCADIPSNSTLLIRSPITISCIFSSLEKQTVLRAKQLIHVLKFRFYALSFGCFFCPLRVCFHRDFSRKRPSRRCKCRQNSCGHTVLFSQQLPYVRVDRYKLVLLPCDRTDHGTFTDL